MSHKNADLPKDKRLAGQESPCSSLRDERHKKKKSCSYGFADINGVLNRLVVKLGLESRLKERALMNFWPQLVGEPMASKSRPLFLDTDRNLVVTVKDSSVGQELSFRKKDILGNLKQIASAMGLCVKGLRFDLKRFHLINQDKIESSGWLNESRTFSGNKLPNTEDLKAVLLSQKDKEALLLLSERLEQKEGQQVHEDKASRIVALFEHELRLRQWLKANDFPLCSACQLPQLNLYGEHGLCSYCFRQQF